MFKKYFLIVLTFLILASIVCIIGCGKSSFAGTYVNQDNPSEYLELKPDGTFYSSKRIYAGMSSTGEWDVKGNELRLHVGIVVYTGEIKGDKIIFRPVLLSNEGGIYVKR